MAGQKGKGNFNRSKGKPLQSQDSTSRNTENNKSQKAQGMQDPLSPRLLTLKQASTYLGCSVRSVREMVYGHEIPVLQRGERSKIWIDKEDLNSWINRSKGLI